MSSNDSKPFPYKQFIVFTGYSIVGIPLLITNGLLLVVILRYSALRNRKEFIIIGALALADALCYGLANIVGGKEFEGYCIHTCIDVIFIGYTLLWHMHDGVPKMKCLKRFTFCFNLFLFQPYTVFLHCWMTHHWN